MKQTSTMSLLRSPTNKNEQQRHVENIINFWSKSKSTIQKTTMSTTTTTTTTTTTGHSSSPNTTGKMLPTTISSCTKSSSKSFRAVTTTTRSILLPILLLTLVFSSSIVVIRNLSLSSTSSLSSIEMTEISSTASSAEIRHPKLYYTEVDSSSSSSSISLDINKNITEQQQKNSLLYTNQNVTEHQTISSSSLLITDANVTEQQIVTSSMYTNANITEEPQQRKQQQNLPQNQTTQQQQQSKKQIHIVFSTGCSALQDWESYVFFYHIWKSKQQGNVTRIVSGCTTKEQKNKIKNDFQSSIIQFMDNNTAPNRFHLHFTPEYSTIHLQYNNTYNKDTQQRGSYKFFNKPYSIQHWMKHKLCITNHTDNKVVDHNNTILIILDPDQIVLKPFLFDYTNDNNMKWKKNPTIDNNNNKQQQLNVRNGYPIGQAYALHTHWIKTTLHAAKECIFQKLKQNYIGPNATNSIEPVSGVHNIVDQQQQQQTNSNDQQEFYKSHDSTNGLLNVSETDFLYYYNVGPPYIGTVYDMYNIVTVWCDIVVPVYYSSNYAHLSEMYAYSLASAYIQLKHSIGLNFMLSSIEKQSTEYWSVDQTTIVPTTDTEKNTKFSNDTGTGSNNFLTWTNPNNYYENDDDSIDTTSTKTSTRTNTQKSTIVSQLPYVFHYCQEYSFGPYYFFKYFVPNTILTCNHPMLLEPPSLLVLSSSSESSSSPGHYSADATFSEEGVGHTDEQYNSDNNKTNNYYNNNRKNNCGLIESMYDYSYSVHYKRNTTNIDSISKRRTVFALCLLITKINDSIQYWKETNCIQPNTSTETTTNTSTVTNRMIANYNKSWVIKDLQDAAMMK